MSSNDRYQKSVPFFDGVSGSAGVVGMRSISRALSPKWLKGPNGDRFMTAAALQTDLMLEATALAVRSGLITRPEMPEDAYDDVAADRNLTLYPITASQGTDARLAALQETVCYLTGAWRHWEYAGTVDRLDTELGRCQLFTSDGLADWSWQAGAPASGTGQVGAPTFFTLTCATSGTTAQINSNAIRTGFGPNALRGFSRDGANWHVLIEPVTTNLVPHRELSEFNTTVGTPVTASCTLPDGTSGINQVTDDDAVNYEYVVDNNALGTVGNPNTLSLWTWLVSLSGGIARIKCREAGNTDLAKVEIAAAESDWTYHSDTSNVASTGDAELYVIPADAQPTNTGTLRASFIQVEEAKLYPTSWISGSRATTYLTVDKLRVTPNGYMDLTLEFSPLFASTELGTALGGEFNVFYIDEDNRCFFSGSTSTWVFRVAGDETETPAGSFARDDRLSVRMVHKSTATQLTVSGSGAADGTHSLSAPTGAQITTSLQDFYIMSSPSGNEAPVGLSAVTSVDPSSFKGAFIYVSGSAAQVSGSLLGANFEVPTSSSNWTRYGVYIPSGTFGPLALGASNATLGSYSVTLGSDASVQDVSIARGVLNKWQPGHTVGQYFIQVVERDPVTMIEDIPSALTGAYVLSGSTYYPLVTWPINGKDTIAQG